MKKLFLLLIILLQLTILKGQQYYSFPDSNAIWHHSFITGSYQPGDTSFYSYGLIGDTVINSIVYSKVYELNDTVLNSNAIYHGCLREDSSKRIFYIGWDYWKMNFFSQEIQLYDFSKTVGDSINYGIWGKQPIISVDSVLIGLTYRKRFEVIWDTFIEGIGCTGDLLSPINDIPTKVFTNWDLICFKQDDDILYLNPNYPTCFTTTVGINENAVNIISEIKIYPQPITNISVIDLTCTKTQFKYLTIYNLLGKTIHHSEIINKKTIQLLRNDFNSGMYLYKLESTYGNIMTGKFIVE